MTASVWTFKEVFTPRTTFCSKLHFIIQKWMVLLPVNESIPYKNHNLLKITLLCRESSVPVPGSITSCLFSNLSFCFVGKKWRILVLWSILIQKHNWSEICSPSCEELWSIKEFALINKLFVSHAGKLSSV